MRTIRSGTIPLLSWLLAPFRASSPALDQSATASVAASLGNVDPPLISHSFPLLASIVSANQHSSSTSSSAPSPSPSPSPQTRLVFQPSLHPSPLLPFFSASPLPRSQLFFFFFGSGQQKSVFSSLLSTVMTGLPIHLLGLLVFPATRLQNPVQLQSLHK